MEINNNIREYKIQEICFFRKTKEQFGGLSNMASGYPITINNTNILTSEALYQACRFPENPEIQEKIILEKSPMSAKMVNKPFRHLTRSDWDTKRVEIMRWCLKVKLAQNFITFGHLLETTKFLPIVEESSKDAFWGAVKVKDNENLLRGTNALGRLLMELRMEYFSDKKYDLLFVEKPNIPNFFLLDKPIQDIDERKNFINSLSQHIGLNKSQLSLEDKEMINYYETKQQKSKTIKSTTRKKVINLNPSLFP